MAGRNTVENVDIKLTATDDASKVVAKVGDTIDKELGDPVDVKVAADTADATRDLAKVKTEADAVDGADPTVTIHTTGADDILADLHKVQTEAGQTHDRLSAVGDGAKDAGTKTSGALGSITQGLGQLDGPIGDLAQQFDNVAGAAAGFGGLGGAIGALAGPLGIAAGAVAAFWKVWTDSAAAAQKRLEDVKQAQLDLAAGDAISTTKLLADEYQKWGGVVHDAGISMDTFTKIMTGQLTVHDAVQQGLAQDTTELDLLAHSIQDSGNQWNQATAELKAHQEAQLQAAITIGATNDELFAMAKTFLPQTKNEVLGYILSVNQIPESKRTEIMALPDNQKIDAVKKLLDDTAKDRDSTITAQADTADAEAQLDRAARDRWAQITASISAQMQGSVAVAGTASRAAGPAGRSVGALGGPMAVPLVTVPHYTINVNLPVGTPTAEVGRYVADAIDLHERRAGRRRRAVS